MQIASHEGIKDCVKIGMHNFQQDHIAIKYDEIFSYVCVLWSKLKRKTYERYQMETDILSEKLLRFYFFLIDYNYIEGIAW